MSIFCKKLVKNMASFISSADKTLCNKQSDGRRVSGTTGQGLTRVHSTRRSTKQLWANDYNMSGEYHLRLLTGRQYKGDPSHPQ